MKENVIKRKSFAFALNIVKLNLYLTDSNKEYILSKQLLRSGTAIGALVREAEHVENKSDFIHKFSIGLKEANKTVYGLELHQKSGYLDENNYELFFVEIKEQIRLLISIIKSSKLK